MNKKILIATGIFPPDIGGPATYSKTLLEKLPEREFEIKLVSYGESKDSTNKFFISRNQNIVFRYFKFFWKVFRLMPWADIVYVQGPVSEGLPSFVAAKLRGKKYFLKVVGDYAWEQFQSNQKSIKSKVPGFISPDEFQNLRFDFKTELRRKIQKMVAKGALEIITPSEYLKNIVEKWGVKRDKIKVIYNSVKKIELDLEKSEAKRKLNLEGDIILSAGRLVPWKGFDILIDLMSELEKTAPNLKLLIAGEGPEKDNLQLEIKNYELEEKIILLGKVEQGRLWEYLRAADMFVLNTGYEGLSHILIEAMMIGAPIITTDVGGNGELIKNNRSGILVEYNNRESIKTAILKLLRERDYGDELASNAKKDLEKFSQEQMLDKISEYFINK